VYHDNELYFLIGYVQDICLDHYLGRTKVLQLPLILHPKRQVINAFISVSKHFFAQKKASHASGSIGSRYQHASHLKKPQLSFKRKVENNDLPWHPMLSHKYNAKVPLGNQHRDSDVDINSSDSHLMEHFSAARSQLTFIFRSSHPYRYEIAHISYPETMFQSTIPIPPKAFKDTRSPGSLPRRISVLCSPAFDRFLKLPWT